MTNRTFMTVEEVAAELGVSKSYAYKIVKQLNDELQKEQLQKTDASDMESVMPETERTEVEIKEPVERQPEPKQPEMTRLASKYPRFFKINNELEQQNNAIYKK